ncbi:MAG: Putative Holliday junction resolvase [Microgenomates bacterium 39_7]|nr:MAG: Putative Holliday junction resolvase [Microgenomates bacterium 39_7]
MTDQVVLAIDYGTRRIGLAISKSTLAIPLKVIEFDQLQVAIQEIKKICDDYRVSQLVIGLSEQQMAYQTKVFASILEEKIDLPLDFIDETLSSQDAFIKLKERKKSLRDGPIDHFAAALILQEWFDTRDSSSE